MQWPSRALGLLYSELYSKYGTSVFSLDDAEKITGSPLRGKVYMHRLRSLGWAFAFKPAGVGTYRLQRPEVCTYISSGSVGGLASLKEQTYTGLLGSLAAESIAEEPWLKSLVLYGSVARGTTRADSDVDVLMLVDDKANLREAFDFMLELEKNALSDEVKYLASYGVDTKVSLLPMSTSHLSDHPFVLLDIAFDGVIIHDDGAFKIEREKVRERVRKLGAKRVFLGDGSWYWDLLPQYSSGMVVEI